MKNYFLTINTIKMKTLFIFLLGIIACSCNVQKPIILCPDNNSVPEKIVGELPKAQNDELKFPQGFYDTLKVYFENINDNFYEKEKTKSEFLKELIKHRMDCESLDSIIIKFCNNLKNNFITDSINRREFEKYLMAYITKKNFILIGGQNWRVKRRRKKLDKKNILPCLPKPEKFDKNCVEKWKKYREILCANQCDTCEIIKEYCSRKGKPFNKEKCKCESIPKIKAWGIIDKIMNENKPPCTNLTLDVKRTNKGQDIWVSIYYENDVKAICGGSISKEGYDTAKYDIPPTLKAYINKFCKNMTKMFKERGWEENSARVNIVGVADGLKILPYVSYSGYENINISDPIHMKRENYLIINNYKDENECGHENDKDFIFNSKKENQNKIINNIQLAYLRAYPIKQIITDTAHFSNLKNLGIYTIAAPEPGKKNRRIELHMLIREATLETGGGEQINNVWLKRMKKCAEK